MKKLLFFSVFLLSLFLSYGEDNESKVNNPNLITKLQGTWIQEEPGTTWMKIVITGNKFYKCGAYPSDGKWYTGFEGQLVDPTLHTWTSRSNFNGKVSTTKYEYVLLVPHGEQYIVYKMDGKIPYFYLTTGSDLSGEYSEGIFYKKSPNYNPWK